MNTKWHHIGIYVAGVYALSIVGGVLVSQGQDIGGLLFIISPILLAVILRVGFRQGWQTAGLRPNFRGHGYDYALAVLVWPIIAAITLTGGIITGALTVPNGLIGMWLVGIVTMLPLTLLYSICEEFGWRGYLEPQLEKLGVPDFYRHLLVGVIWALWHIPYLMTFGSVANLPAWQLIPLYGVATLAMAVWYGVSRKRTNSVWPAVIAHGWANAILWPLIVGEIVTINSSLIFAPRPESILMGGLLVLVATMVWVRRRT